MNQIKQWWYNLTLWLVPYKRLYYEAGDRDTEIIIELNRENQQYRAHENAMAFLKKLNGNPMILNAYVENRNLFVWVFYWESVLKGVGNSSSGKIELYRFDDKFSELMAYVHFDLIRTVYSIDLTKHHIEPKELCIYLSGSSIDVTKTYIDLVELRVIHKSERDKGYGSKALYYLKYLGFIFHAKSIVGILSDVDTEHSGDPNNGKRLYSFYPKNKFSISGDPPCEKLRYVFDYEKIQNEGLSTM